MEEERLNLTLLKELIENTKVLNSNIERMLNKVEVYINNTKQDTSDTKQSTGISIPKNLVSNQDIKIPKDRPFINQVLERCTNPASQKFLKSILYSDYDTITVKQKQVLDSIISQL